MPVDAEKFIALVRESPPLWDRRLKEYSEHAARDACWATIGGAVYADWRLLDDEVRRARMREMKNKWRHLRDSFIKERNRAGTANPRSKRGYVHYDRLSFLVGAARRRRRPAKEEGEEEEEPEPEADEGGEGYDCGDAIDDFLETDVVQSDPDWVPEAKMLVVQSQQYQQQQYQQQQQAAPDEDPDRLFILSMLPDYKRLDDDEKLDFKLMNLQFFRDVRQRKSASVTQATRLGRRRVQ